MKVSNTPKPMHHTNAGPLSLQSRLKRHFRPPKLNILTRDRDTTGETREVFRPQDTSPWRLNNETDTDPEYVFICYTRDQFSRQHDVVLLHRLAQKAACDAGLKAYWLDSMLILICL